MVALTISAGLVLGGRLLLEQITTAERAVQTDAAVLDTAVSRARLLRGLIRNLEVGSDSLTTFGGNEHLAQFTSWCVDSVGERTRCTVRLTLDTALTVATSSAPGVVLRHAISGGQLRYLGDARHGGQWYRTWKTSVTAPLAVGVVVGRDTTVLRIGDRQ